MKFVVDRFEGDMAILEDENKNMHEIPKSVLPKCCEGDVILILKDEEETKKRESRIKNLASELFE